MKITISFYKNAGAERLTCFHNSYEIFESVFTKNKSYNVDKDSKITIHELNNQYIFLSCEIEKENNDPNLKIKDKDTNTIIESPSFIYAAFVLIDHKTGLVALVGKDGVLRLLEQYVLKNTNLVISEKHISFGPYSIDEKEIKRKIKAAKKIKSIKIPITYEKIKDNFAEFKQINHAIDEKKLINLKLALKDEGVNYSESIYSIEKKTFEQLELVIDNERDREEVINIMKNVFTRKAYVDLQKNEKDDDKIIKLMEETMKKELEHLISSNS